MAKRIVILGGGFGGVYTARTLEKLLDRDEGVEVTLVSRNNYFLLTPLLFEAGSGVLEPRHAVNPIRLLIPRTRFVQAEVERIDLEQRRVHTRMAGERALTMEYDQLVLALGGVTNTGLLKGAEHAVAFKTLADAIRVRNRTIELFEQADVETDPDRKQALLTFVVIGAGFVGVELMGELTAFTERLTRVYPRIDPSHLRFELVESLGRIAPEFDDELARYIAGTFSERGVNIRVNSRVAAIEPGVVRLESGEGIRAQTVINATGVVASPVVAALPLEKGRHGRVVVDATMRVKGREDLWALGDCAAIPSPDGKLYPPLAQHALREARVLGENIANHLRGRELLPFRYETIGVLAALGHTRGAGKVYGVRVRGFIAWWLWRSYYLMRMPQWRRRIRVMIDWTVALVLGSDIVELDLGAERGRGRASDREVSDG